MATGLPLLVSAGLVQLSALMLGGDTGLGHLAVAQGRRVMMLMMHNNPGACVPFRHPDWAVAPERSHEHPEYRTGNRPGGNGTGARQSTST